MRKVVNKVLPLILLRFSFFNGFPSGPKMSTVVVAFPSLSITVVVILVIPLCITSAMLVFIPSSVIVVTFV